MENEEAIEALVLVIQHLLRKLEEKEVLNSNETYDLLDAVLAAMRRGSFEAGSVFRMVGRLYLPVRSAD